MSSETKARKVPSNALQFDAGKIQFADGDANDSMRAPIKMLGRSAQPIYHWYWGQIVHDMAGFTPDHPRVPIDWCHDDYEELGYLDTFQADNNGLNVSGELVSIEDKDRASKIMKKAKAGVPYQASIFFRAENVEEVQAGASAQVNGYTVQGPATIVRKWSLRGMAVCLYGADHRTQSQFKDQDEEVLVNILTVEHSMSKDTTSTQPNQLAGGNKADGALGNQASTNPATLTNVSPETSTANKLAETDPRAELKKFVAAFGAENGATWFADGLSFADAQTKHVEVLTKKLSDKNAELEASNKKLASIDRGEQTPASFNDAEKPAEKKVVDRFAHLGDNLGKFAGSIKLPTK